MKLLSIIFLLIFSFSIHAATFTVTRTDDRNAVCNSGVDCSLREAVAAANVNVDADTINFSLPLPATINLTAGELFIFNNVSIIGTGARNFTIQRSATSGTAKFRIFNLQGAAITVNISGLTIANGFAASSSGGGGGGGGIRNGNFATLNLFNVSMRNNTGVSGGAILNYGILNLTGSILESNSCAVGCGVNNNGEYPVAKVTISNTTITNNRAVPMIDGPNTVSGTGGAIANFASDIYLTNVTVSHNSATGEVGGIYGSLVFIRNTIIAKNTAPQYPDAIFINSLGSNIVGIDSGGLYGFSEAKGDKVGTQSNPIDPKLGDLQNNGGETDTRALLPGSPAIDKGNNSNSPGATDQRGFARIVNGIIDIGAYEVQTIGCTYSISPTSQNFTQSGGSFNIFLTTQPGCAFTSVSNNDFISIDYGANNAGTSNVGIFVLPNNTGSTRTGTLSIAGQTFTVTQAANKKRTRLVLF